MSTKEEVLRKETFKEEAIQLDQRVFYTVFGDQPPKPTPNDPTYWQVQRNSKLLAALVKKLRATNVLSDTDIDDILFETVR
jgi:hypothetical protein